MFHWPMFHWPDISSTRCFIGQTFHQPILRWDISPTLVISYGPVKCHRLSMGQWYVQLMKCPVEEMSSWGNVQLRKCPLEEMSSWGNVQLRKCPVEEMSSWGNVKLRKCPVRKICPVDEMSTWWNVQSMKCPANEMPLHSHNREWQCVEMMNVWLSVCRYAEYQNAEYH